MARALFRDYGDTNLIGKGKARDFTFYLSPGGTPVTDVLRASDNSATGGTITSVGRAPDVYGPDGANTLYVKTQGSPVRELMRQGPPVTDTVDETPRLSEVGQLIAASETRANGTYESKTSIGYKLRRAAVRASARKGVNAVELPTMANPPTISSSVSTAGSGLTVQKFAVVSAANAALYRFRGGTPTLTSTNWYRFPCVTLPTGVGNAQTTPTNRNAYGWAVEWMSDAPIIDIHVLCGAGSTARLLIDGQPVSTANLAYPNTSGSAIFNVDFTAVGGRQNRHFRWEGLGDAGFRGVGIGVFDSVWPVETGLDLKVATLGDSVCANTGATDPNGGWQHQFAKLVGITDIRQVGLGSSGLVNTGTYNSNFGDATRLADLVEIQPDVILMMSSVNDQAKTAGTVQAAALAAFQLWRTNFPNALIVVSGLWPGSGNNSAAQLLVETEVLAAFTAWADGNSVFVPVNATGTDTPWVTGTGFVGATSGSGNSNVLNQDISHPNQAGHDYLAQRWATAWRTLVLPAVK